ncbi:MAG TPA: hypothetical protein EYP88_00695 [Anaerolineales bacterium]|nr:hypothetical protein [Anaerolineales bacterium]
MDILGIGLPEVFFTVLLALIIFGPNDVVKASRAVGRFMRKVVTSDVWKVMQTTTKEIQHLPTTLMREAGLEDKNWDELTGISEVNRVARDFNRQIASSWLSPDASSAANKSRLSADEPATIDNPSDHDQDVPTAWLSGSTQPEPTIAPPQSGAKSAPKHHLKQAALPPDAPFTEIIDEGDLSGDA